MDRRSGMKKLWAALLLAGLLVTPARAETVTYLHTDLLGSVVLETDQNRNVVARYEYEPYGLPRQAIADQPGYTGHVHDAGSGLVYMQQRYYDPEVGRFLSIDPVGVDIATGANFNRYWYGNDNPYRYVDPDGRHGVAVTFPDYKISLAGRKWEDLGHAGILLINPANGLTRYYEFERYPEGSIVRNLRLESNVTMRDGAPTTESLARVLSELSRKAGQGGPIEGAYFVGADFAAMEAYAKGLAGKTAGKGGYGDWHPYHQCGTFQRDTLENGGIDTPWMADPRPNSYIKELQGSEGAQSFRFEGGGFQGVFRVDGRLDSKRLDRDR
ncbi:RHS repeat-associated core domain-containing protein [Thioalkalivibrio sp. XN279]|nr:RHS repeat-associated core domain-containing protein [Thioalkalivibrio sp. XN279]